MGRQYNIIRTGPVQRGFECRGCGAHANLIVLARGESGWRPEGGYDVSGSAAYQAAGGDLRSDAGRILGVMRCPSCGVRSKRGVAASMVRLIASLVIALIGGGCLILVAPPEHMVIIGIPIAALALLIGSSQERRRWREAARCAKGATVVAPLPRAVAAVRPSLPAAPLEPLRTSAPERVEPSAAENGPSFLR